LASGSTRMEDRKLDRQDAVVLALGWLAALWITLA
jgi:hypothetical protein